MPVSLTAVPCKIMVRDLMIDRLYDNEQHGLVIGKSAETNLLEIVDYISYNSEKGCEVLLASISEY